jgi:hypothetical protein
MLQFTDGAGYTWYINHLISTVILTGTFLWTCKQEFSGHKDKFLHYSISFGITLLLIWLLPLIHMAWWWSPIVALAIGASKEWYDYYHPKTRTCDIHDFIADSLGVLAMTTLYLFSFLMAK